MSAKFRPGNQAAPLLVSNKGRWVWCERPFVFCFSNGVLSVEADRPDAEVETGTAGDTLRSATSWKVRAGSRSRRRLTACRTGSS